MKKWSFFILMTLFLGGMTIAVSSCSDDDAEDAPTCTDGIQNGDETGVDCGGSCDPCVIGIVGEWQSSGTNVAPLLVDLQGVDSIYARFNEDNTYLVESYDTAAVLTRFEGTYLFSESGVGNIMDITLEQTIPFPGTSVGIYEINGSTMNYEVVLTVPDIGATPPTAAEGFGSTNGGMGLSNIQVYERID